MEKYKAHVNKSNANIKKIYINSLVRQVSGIKAFESQTLPYTVYIPSNKKTVTCNKHATINAENMVAIKKQLNEKAKFHNYMFDGDVPFPNPDGSKDTEDTIVPGVPDNILFIILGVLALCVLYLMIRPSSEGGPQPAPIDDRQSDVRSNYGYYY